METVRTNRLDPNSYLEFVGGGCAAGTDGHSAYKRVLPGLGVTNHLVFPSDGSAGRGLWRVNAAHERLKAFLVPPAGVSTRYLPFHLKWWRFVEFVRRAGRDCLAAPGTRWPAAGTASGGRASRRNNDLSGIGGRQG